MRHIVINDSKEPLFLLEQEVPKVPASLRLVASTPDNVNHIFIADVSGSMHGVLPKLAEDISSHVRKLKVGDTLSFAWFSGPGDYRFVLKGYKISDDKDFDKLEKTFKENLRSRGSTCFSEVLAETSSVIKDLGLINEVFAMTFFTDGYPTVYPMDKEVKSIHSAITNIQGKIASSMLVGYGDYYNKELMTDMAERLGGSLIHSSTLATFSTAFTVFMEESRDAATKVEVTLEADVNDQAVVFGINGRQINLYKPTEKGVIDFAPTKKSRDCVYILTNQLPAGSKEVTLPDSTVYGKNHETESVVKGAYAAAYVLTQKTKVDRALNILGKLGDVALIERVTNSYTNAEYGVTETEIAAAAFGASKRFAKGRNVNFLPPDNAFCLMDVISLAQADPDAYFYPTHDSFQYKRIGKLSEAKSGYPKFESDKAARCSMKDLTWNDTMLNLSLRAKINGVVPLNGDATKLGFSQNYPSYIYRNYTLVKDGFLNLQTLPVSVSNLTFLTLQTNGVIDASETWADGKVVTLNLSAVPVINRAMAEGKTSATDLCKKVIQETALEAQVKALKFLRDGLEAVAPKTEKTNLTEEQNTFLESNGIVRGAYSPPSVQAAATDFYMAKEFEIKLKGLSSLPKVTDVTKIVGEDGKTKPTKALTVGQQLVHTGLQMFWNSSVVNDTPAQKISWLENTTKDIQVKLLKVRRDIQETKFAVLLGKKWFNEFTSREENTLTVDNHTCTVSVREVKVDF